MPKFWRFTSPRREFNPALISSLSALGGNCVAGLVPVNMGKASVRPGRLTRGHGWREIAAVLISCPGNSSIFKFERSADTARRRIVAFIAIASRTIPRAGLSSEPLTVR